MGAVQSPQCDRSETIHASCVSTDGQAVVILGASGTGKSSLALQLIALGADLVADDRTILSIKKDVLYARCPDTIKGLIEARGVGILHSPSTGQTPVSLIVDLNKIEEMRLPSPHTETILGVTLPCLWHAPSPHFAAAVLQCLRHGVDQKHDRA